MSIAEDSKSEELVKLISRPTIIESQCPLIRYPHSHLIPIKPLPFRSASGGLLEQLPLELKQNIILTLDFKTLGSLRLTCYHFLNVVDCLPAYQRIVQHASTALRALRDTRTIKYYSVSQVYQAIISSKCTQCGEFGPFLYVLTCERTCFNCLYRNLALRAIPKSDIQMYFALDARHVQKLRTMRSRESEPAPGHFDPWPRCSHYPSRLILLRQAQDIALQMYGGKSELRKKVVDGYLRRVERHETTKERTGKGIYVGGRRIRDDSLPDVGRPKDVTALFGPWWPRGSLSFERDFHWRWNRHPMDQYTCTGAVEMPILDTATLKREFGVWCEGCEKVFKWALGIAGDPFNYETLRDLERNYLRAWLKEDLLKHVEVCRKNKMIWMEDVRAYLAVAAAAPPPPPPRPPNLLLPLPQWRPPQNHPNPPRHRHWPPTWPDSGRNYPTPPPPGPPVRYPGFSYSDCLSLD